MGGGCITFIAVFKTEFLKSTYMGVHEVPLSPLCTSMPKHTVMKCSSYEYCPRSPIVKRIWGKVICLKFVFSKNLLGTKIAIAQHVLSRYKKNINCLKKVEGLVFGKKLIKK